MPISQPEKNFILVMGGFGLPDRTASAIRAIGICKALKAVGYNPIILGKFAEIPEGEADDHLIDVNGIPARDIRRPWPDSEVCNYARSGTSVEDVITRLGPQNVSGVILYNYPSLGIASVVRVCARSDTPVALDLTEWYGWEGKKVVRNVFRIINSEVRMRILSRMVGNVICTSSWLANRLKVSNKLVLPFVIDSSEERWSLRRKSLPKDPGRKVFVYSGSPGVSMYKDRLPEIIQAFSELSKTRRDFEFKVYGITRDQFLRGAPEKAPEIDQIGNCLSFHGRVSHSASLDALSQSHFSIFLRKSNRVSNAGFPTKYMEASTIGVPVIANITSDIGQFLSHGRNGFVVEGFDPAQVLQTLREAMSLNENEYKEMRDRQLENDPFSVENWKFKMKEFLRLSGMRIS